ncbi:hypothetical protein CC79DRAFT_1337282 [Sarocladium strictum]
MGLLKQIARSLGFVDPVQITPSERDHPQDAALIFNRLPPEIRNQIWGAYFHSIETNLIHIGSRGNTANECIADNRSIFSLEAHQVCSNKEQKRDRIKLLLTCKRVYFEAVFCLYDGTLFDLSCGHYTISDFRKKIPVWHFATIRKVSISFAENARSPTSPTGKGAKFKETMQWPIIWQSLAAMESLRWLRFEVLLINWTGGEKHWKYQRDHVLGPMMLVTQTSYFELILPFEVDDWAERLPCHVIRFDDTPPWGHRLT